MEGTLAVSLHLQLGKIEYLCSRTIRPIEITICAVGTVATCNSMVRKTLSRQLLIDFVVDMVYIYCH